MASAWGYEGTRVIVAGGGGAGMGAAATTELTNLGAEVHVIDLREPPLKVAGYHDTDLSDPDATARTVEEIGGEINALFYCAGRPGRTYSDLEVMTVNLLSAKHLAGLVVPLMPAGSAIASISSTAGMGWMPNIAKWMPLVTADGFDAGLAWVKEHPDEILGGYSPSKEALIIWTLWASYALAEKGIRINSISPGPTTTPMMPDFEAAVGKEFMDTFPIPLGHHASPEEQAYPLLFLNSRAASFITGENINTDGGTMGALMTGSIDPVIFAGAGAAAAAADGDR
jgi:NAD(P)-dependent dehydrogenase (short-subunit alcohol dehydrogenase family)